MLFCILERSSVLQGTKAKAAQNLQQTSSEQPKG